MKKLVVSNFVILNKNPFIILLIFIIDTMASYFLKEIKEKYLIISFPLILIIISIFIPKFITSLDNRFVLLNKRKCYVNLFLTTIIFIFVFFIGFSIIYYSGNKWIYLSTKLIVEGYPKILGITDVVWNLIDILFFTFFAFLLFFIYYFALFLWSFSLYFIITHTTQYGEFLSVSIYRLIINKIIKNSFVVIKFIFLPFLILTGYIMISSPLLLSFSKSIFVEILFRFFGIYILLWVIVWNLNVARVLEVSEVTNNQKDRLNLLKVLKISVIIIIVSCGLVFISILLGTDKIRAHIWITKCDTYFADGKYNEAARCYSKAINSNIEIPGVYEVYIKAGCSYNKIGNYDKAIKFLEESIKLNPNCSGSYYQLGISYYHKNDRENAIKMWKKAVDLGDPYGFAKWSLKEKYGIDYEK